MADSDADQDFFDDSSTQRPQPQSHPLRDAGDTKVGAFASANGTSAGGRSDSRASGAASGAMVVDEDSDGAAENASNWRSEFSSLPNDWAPDFEFHERASSTFVGQWNQLVSQTNWEKGRVILHWRRALEEKGAPAAEFSDEAWSRLVGGVTSQHVGRLRRVYARFGLQHSEYASLFWSHFHAAMDWDDAELWLQGACESTWSVSQMRNQRWETMGKLTDQKPDPADVVQSELDEDLETRDSRGNRDDIDDFQSSPRLEGPDFGDESDSDDNEPRSKKDRDEEADLATNLSDDGDRVTVTNEDTIPGLKPFQDMGELPEDFSDLVEDFKLAIIRFKSDRWADVTQQQILSVLDGLKYIATTGTDLD